MMFALRGLVCLPTTDGSQSYGTRLSALLAEAGLRSQVSNRSSMLLFLTAVAMGGAGIVAVHARSWAAVTGEFVSQGCPLAIRVRKPSRTLPTLPPGPALTLSPILQVTVTPLTMLVSRSLADGLVL